jgi:hypothetical protein
VSGFPSARYFVALDLTLLPIFPRCMAEKLHTIRAASDSPVGRGGLRLPEMAWTDTIAIRQELPAAGFAGFPHYRVFTFQIFDSRAVKCWHRTCGIKSGKCRGGWTQAQGLEAILDLETAYKLGVDWTQRKDLTLAQKLESVAGVYDIAWLRQ